MQRKFVQIDSGTVTATLEAPAAPTKLPTGRTFVEVDEFPPLLSTYDEAAKTFTPPPPPPDYGRAVDVREFMLLFTQAERIAIRAAAATDPEVADWQDVVRAPVPIRLRHPTTRAGLDRLVAKGLLTAARRDAIQSA